MSDGGELSAPFFRTDSPGARLAVFAEGGGGDPVLLLHGGPGVPDYLGEVAAILASEHRVVRFDQRGTGRSTCTSGRFELDDYVNDVDCVRRALGVERLNLFGHSWGGLLAQLYASRYPECVAKLLLCSPSIGLGKDWQVMERAVMAYNRRQSGLGGFALLGVDQLLAMLPGSAGDWGARRMMARVWRNYFDPPASAPAPNPEWLAGVHSRPIFATRRAALAGDMGRLSALPATRMLIMFGARDIYGDTRELLIARCPNAEVLTIPGAGHIPWLQDRAAFSAATRRFFA